MRGDVAGRRRARLRARWALPILLYGLVPVAAEAAGTFHVDNQHPAASDANPGTPSLPFNTADAKPAPPAADTIYDQLATLKPPRKHYQRYYATREANDNMWRANQGIHAFLRAYYHMKSADWKQNKPHPLSARTAEEWAKMPRYYIMDLDKGMAEQVAEEMPSAAEIARRRESARASQANAGFAPSSAGTPEQPGR